MNEFEKKMKFNTKSFYFRHPLIILFPYNEI